MVLVPIYLGVTLFLFARLCLDVVSTAMLSGRALSIGPASDLLPDLDHACADVQVKVSSEIRTPLTWGAMKPRVLLPRGATDWDTQDLSMVLQHELTHIERADWMGHLLARCVHALYWPVPGIRQLMRQLSLSMEQACDDRVLATGVSAPRYAAMQLGNRPEIPELIWGSANQKKESAAAIAPLEALQFDESVMAALHPGPRHPLRPPEAEKPPKYKGQEKPTIPPP